VDRLQSNARQNRLTTVLAPLLRFKIEALDQHSAVSAPEESVRQLIVADEQNLAALLAPQYRSWPSTEA
jgi:hypothetical protein